MDRTCPACGTTVTDPTARHCPQCGARLGEGQPPPADTAAAGAGSPAVHDADARNWATGAHLSAFLGAWLALAFVGPLAVWLTKGREHPFIAEHAREALNFNLTFLIWLAIAGVLAFVLIGIPLLIALGILWLVVTIRAAVAASRGESYRYPITIRFIS